MRYHNITRDDMLNGDGLRVVLWVSGCSHCCEDCHNPITWDSNGGIEFDEDAKNEIFQELEKSYVHGITFSGGDPLHSDNVSEVADLAREIKARYKNKTIWLYTGYLWESIKDMEIIEFLDVVVDGPFECDRKDITLQWKGSSNQRVIDVKQSREKKEVVLHI